MTDRIRLYTVDDFEQLLKLPQNEERRFELIDGEIAEKGMPTPEHGYIVDSTSFPIRDHLKKNRLGRGGPEIRYRIPGDPYHTLMPDWSFTLGIDEPIIIQGAFQRLPDFALEVLSPDDNLDELRNKAEVYLRHGTKLVWLAIPRLQVIEVYWSDGRRGVYGVGQTLDFGDLLPGLTISVRDIFDL